MAMAWCSRCRSRRRFWHDPSTNLDKIPCSLHTYCSASARIHSDDLGKSDGAEQDWAWRRVSRFLGWSAAGDWEGVVLGGAADELVCAGGILHVFQEGAIE